MSTGSSLAETTPGLSMQLTNFAAEDPGSWEPLLDRARAADRAGIDRLIVSDHVVYGENLDAYSRPELGGTEGGKQPTGPDGHWLEPMTLLSVVAGITTHTRLGTGILLAALRRPVVLAKSAATLDVLSGGRLDLGVGVGWQREEYVAAGLDFEERGRLLDHTLEVCQALWRDSPATYHSPELEFESIHCMPHPRQAGGVPLWVSGTINNRVLTRIARFGSGWIPWGKDAANPASGVARVREALEAAGRDTAGLQVRGSVPVVKDANGGMDIERSMEGIPALVEAGVTDFGLRVNLPEDASAAGDYLAGIVAAFRKTVGRSL